jgi:protein MpaA
MKWPLRALLAALALLLLASPGGAAVGRRLGLERIPLGRSERGRLIVAYRTGDPSGVPVLVVGCIHGTECAGIAIARALERVRTDLDLWIVPDLNPDGYAAGTRQDARGVDLNRNWSSQWPGGGRPWDTYYPGPRPFSERETRIARDLIRSSRRRRSGSTSTWTSSGHGARAPARAGSTPAPRGCASTTTTGSTAPP